jgi:flagellar biosynthetic protein FlhB
MAEGSMGGQDRTERPTPRRRWQARQEGRVARSTELSASVVLIGGALSFLAVGSASFANYTQNLLRQTTQSLSLSELSSEGTLGILRGAADGFLSAYLPFVIGLGVIVLFVNLMQARGVVSWNLVQPKFSHINPVSGVRRLFGTESLFSALKGFLKLCALAVLTYFVISRSWPQLISLSEADPSGIATVLKGLVLRLALLMGIAYLLVGGIDSVYQHFKLERSLKMTKQEVFYDLKDSEGDPRVKARITAVARAQARRRMLQKVPTADVVVVNPTEIAVALKYDVEMAPAPLVLALGQRKLAERIRSIALRADVPIVENRPVARALLATGKVGKPIPQALYAAVAEILAFVYRQRGGLSGLPPNLIPRRTA